MPKRGKRYSEALKHLEVGKQYEPREALEIISGLSLAKFDETVEIAMRLGVNPRHADQMVRGAVILPHGTGKEARVLVFARGDKANEAREAGADFVGAEDFAEKIQGGWLDFDRAVATPDMMSIVGRLGRILGPRGLMPNPRTGTVTTDIESAVKEIKQGKVDFRTDRGGIIHGRIGRTSFGSDKLLDNFYAFVEAIIRARPPGAKGQYIRSVTLSSTMGPGIPIDVSQVARPQRA